MTKDTPKDRRGPTLIDGAEQAAAPRRGPTLIEDVSALPDAPDAIEAPDVDAPSLEPAAGATALKLAARGGPSLLSRLFWSALVSLMLMIVGLWFWETVETLLARNIWLGRIAFGLTLIVGAALIGWTMKELAALSRLNRVDKLKDRADRAHRSREAGAARDVVGALNRLYRSRPELAEPRSALSATVDELLDGDAIIDAAERSYMTPLDAAAAAAARRGARQVATATALMPLALIDVLAALTVNVRMIREIAEIYGGRAGWLGSWRLLRSVAAHLIATGAVAVGDDMIGAALGGGVLSRLSRRFGEGLVNGALTARIGLAAMEVCRPLPFHAVPQPSVSGLIKGAFADLTSRDKS